MKNANTLVKVVADSIEKVRPCDAWRLYETAVNAGANALLVIKEELRKRNPPAFAALLEYEKEESGH